MEKRMFIFKDKINAAVRKIVLINAGVKAGFLQWQGDKRAKKRSDWRREQRQQEKFNREVSTNPYLQSKSLCNDVFASQSKQIETRNYIIYGLVGLCLLVVFGYIHLASETKIKPIFSIIHGNEVFTVPSSNFDDAKKLQPRLTPMFIKNYIRAIVSVSIDGDVNNRSEMKALAFSQAAAVNKVKQYFEKHNKNVIARKNIVSVSNLTYLPISKHTVEVHWTQTYKNNQTGRFIKSINYLGHFSFYYGKPADSESILRFNPLGLYVKDFTIANTTI